MSSFELFESFSSPVIDYQSLMQTLRDYRAPRAKVTELLKRGDLIHLKKGLYLIARSRDAQSVPIGTVANLIYGPSYLSLQWALSFYGLIPERVEQLTSVTLSKNKLFSTPVGAFSYRFQKQQIFMTGSRLESQAPGSFLIATREKALADHLYFATPSCENERELRDYLADDLRLELKMLNKFSLTKLDAIAKAMNKSSVHLLSRLVRNERSA